MSIIGSRSSRTASTSIAELGEAEQLVPLGELSSGPQRDCRAVLVRACDVAGSHLEFDCQWAQRLGNLEFDAAHFDDFVGVDGATETPALFAVDPSGDGVYDGELERFAEVADQVDVELQSVVRVDPGRWFISDHEYWSASGTHRPERGLRHAIVIEHTR